MAKTETTRKVHTTKGQVKGYDRATWNYMKKEFNLSEADVLGMSAAICPAKVNGIDANLIRFFKTELSKEKGGIIADYETLNAHPDFILYEGYRTLGAGGETIIKKRESVGTSFLEEKTKQGAITEIGLEKEKTGGQKFLSSFGHFMMMGGFMLVLIGIFVIYILISMIKC